MEGAFPKALYRPGTQYPGTWGAHDVDLLTVESAEEEADALKDGWFVSPDCAPVQRPKLKVAA